MSDGVPKPRRQSRECRPRPLPLTILCLVWTVCLGLTIGWVIRIYRAGFMQFDVFLSYLAFWVRSGIWLIGLWRMKRWGAKLALASLLFEIGSGLYRGTILPQLASATNHAPLFISALAIYFIIHFYYRKMD